MSLRPFPAAAFLPLLLTASLVLDCGVIPGDGLGAPSGGNSGAGPTGRAPRSHAEEYLRALNETRVLEEVIYSDVLNNLRNLVREERNGTSRAASLVWGKQDARGAERKSERAECDGRNKTNSRRSVNSWSSLENVYLSSANEVADKEAARLAAEGFAPGSSGTSGWPRGDEYLLGYSGNPFGTRRPIAGTVELTENDPLAGATGDPRRKRSVVHLYNMVLCTTGCNPFAYKGYGCYCGFLGSGFVVDGIDSCCKMHDWCYNSAGCPMFFEYFIPYLWKCHRRQPLCAIDHGAYGGPGSCAQRLCECDRQLALCLRRYPCPSSKALCTSSPWRLLQNIIML